MVTCLISGALWPQHGAAAALQCHVVIVMNHDGRHYQCQNEIEIGSWWPKHNAPPSYPLSFLALWNDTSDGCGEARFKEKSMLINWTGLPAYLNDEAFPPLDERENISSGQD